jgi:peptidyl-prolyl cis-trans isomerase D
VKVTKIVPGGETSFEQAKQAIRAKVVAAKAADMMYDRANKIDQILGNGGTLDEMPSDLGLKGVEGTLDAQGDTQAGEPAPIAGPAELRSAIVSAAFQTQQGDPPRLTEVPTPSNGGSAYYALVVENVIPPGEKPYDEVKAQVLTDWRQDQKRHTANERATAMMVAVQDGKSFSEAAQAAGVTPHLSPLITRNASDPAIPQALQRVMFTLKPKEATMVEAPDGFVVAQLAEVQKPDPAADKAGYDQARQAVSRSLSGDLASVFIDALRERAEPQINQRNFDNVVQPR